MLKILFFLLLLINGGLFAFQQGYLDEWMSSNHEPARLKQQLNADKLRLLPRLEAESALQTSSATPIKAEENTTVTVSVAEADAALDRTVAAVEKAMASNASTNAPAKPLANIACTEVGNFDPVDAKRFEKKLAALSLQDQTKRRPIPDSLRHAVYIPAQDNRAGAEKKAAELKNLGVDDFFIIQDDTPLQWGISLGVFKTEEAARKHLADLTKKGVRSARISDRGANTAKVAFQLSALNAETLLALKKIKAEFPRQEIRNCGSAE